MTKHRTIDTSKLPFGKKKKAKANIDTSELAISKRHPVRNQKYKQSADGKTCMICGHCDGTIVGCHINYMNFGKGIKASDARIAFMCGGCHRDHDNCDDKGHWWMVNFIFLLLEADFGEFSDG